MGMSAGGEGTDEGTPLSEINVTPLVDVMLVLLIIFMVTAPLLQQGVEVDLPQTKAQSLPADENQNVLTLTKERKVFLGDVEIPFRGLEETLTNNIKLRQDKRIYLNADRALKYDVVVDVMSTLQRSGVESIGLVTNPNVPTKREGRRGR